MSTPGGSTRVAEGPAIRLPSAEPRPQPRPPRAGYVRVLIGDDHPIMSAMIAKVCEERPNVEVVGRAGNGYQAVEMCMELRPDILILDLVMPALDGFTVIRRLRGPDGGGVRILVLSESLDPDTILRCLRLGVHGFIDKSAPLEDIAAAVEAVASGIQVFTLDHRRAAQASLGSLVRQSRQAATITALISPRERQVLDLIVHGLTNHQVASRLGIGERTIESHVGSLYRKLGVTSRMQAINRAVALSLVDLRSAGPGASAGTGG